MQTNIEELINLIPTGASAHERCMLMLIERLDKIETRFEEQVTINSRLQDKIEDETVNRVMDNLNLSGNKGFQLYCKSEKSFVNRIKARLSGEESMLFDEKSESLIVATSANLLQPYRDPDFFRSSFSHITNEDVDPIFFTAEHLKKIA